MDAETPTADLLIVNGRVFRGFGPLDRPPTGSAAGPRPAGAPTAVAVSDGRIAWLGTDAEAARRRGPATEVADARGGLVLAGFEDAHFHLVDGARSLDEVDLSACADLPAIHARVVAAAAAGAGDGWLIGNGWFYAAIPGGLPTARQLDAMVSDRPVYLRCFDGHTGWLNSAGLRAAGIDRDTADPAHGAIVRDAATGVPTGALKEAAVELVERVLPKPSLTDDLGRLRRAIGALHASGVTAVQDAWADARAFDACRRLLAADELSLRVRLALPMTPQPTIGEWARRLDEHDALVGDDRDGAWLSSGIVKAFADGVVESRTAAMLRPYANDTSIGHPNWTAEQLDAHVAEAARRGWQVEIHAIGDAAVRMALDAYQRSDADQRRHRVEHVETIDPADIPRFAELGVVASMQPLHADPAPNQASVWADNIGPERASRGWAWASIRRAGGRLAFGSDWPVVSFDPILGLQSAVNRQTRDGQPAGGWYPGERLSLPDALSAWTVGGAWAARADHRRGTIAPGLDADLVVLDRDLLAEGPSAIIGTGVRLTVVGGRIVHRREDAS